MHLKNKIKQSKKTPMQVALELAKKAAELGEVPVGAVIVRQGEIIASEHNQMQALGDATAHAEMLAIKQAQKNSNITRLNDCDLYVTLEPCTMCAGAIAHSKIRRLYYGAEDKKGGAIDNGVRFFSAKSCHHRPEVISGLMEENCAQLLKKFLDRKSVV